MNEVGSRDVYSPSGRVSMARFLGMLAVLLLALVVMAAVAELALASGALIVLFAAGVLVPALVAVLAAAAIRIGHCRSPALGLTVGVFAGLATLFGQQYLDMVYLVPQAASRPDLVPVFIVEKLNEPIIIEMGDGKRVEHGDSSWVVNWLCFSVYAGLLTAAPAIAAFLTARQPYGEQSSKWLSSVSASASLDTIELLSKEMPNSSLISLAEHIVLDRPFPPPHGELILYFVPGAMLPAGNDPVFVTLRRITTSASASDVFNEKKIAGPWRLEDDEVRLLAGHITRWREPLGFDPSVDWPEEVGAEIAALSDDTLGETPTLEIVEVPAPYAGRILAGARWFADLLAALLLLAAFATLAGGGWLTWRLWNVLPGIELGGVALAGIAGFAALWVIGELFYKPLVGRKYFAIAKREAASRLGRWVDPSEANVHFVQVVDRGHWHIAPDDVGFLQIDPAHRRLLYEGDSARMNIPIDNLVSFDIETFLLTGKATGRERHYFVVLRAKLEDGTLWEAPIAPHPYRLQPYTDRWRSRATQSFREAIASLAAKASAEATLADRSLE